MVCSMPAARPTTSMASKSGAASSAKATQAPMLTSDGVTRHVLLFGFLGERGDANAVLVLGDRDDLAGGDTMAIGENRQRLADDLVEHDDLALAQLAQVLHGDFRAAELDGELHLDAFDQGPIRHGRTAKVVCSSCSSSSAQARASSSHLPERSHTLSSAIKFSPALRGRVRHRPALRTPRLASRQRRCRGERPAGTEFPPCPCPCGALPPAPLPPTWVCPSVSPAAVIAWRRSIRCPFKICPVCGTEGMNCTFTCALWPMEICTESSPSPGGSSRSVAVLLPLRCMAMTEAASAAGVAATLAASAVALAGRGAAAAATPGAPAAGGAWTPLTAALVKVLEASVFEAGAAAVPVPAAALACSEAVATCAGGMGAAACNACIRAVMAAVRAGRRSTRRGRAVGRGRVHRRVQGRTGIRRRLRDGHDRRRGLPACRGRRLGRGSGVGVVQSRLGGAGGGRPLAGRRLGACRTGQGGRLCSRRWRGAPPCRFRHAVRIGSRVLPRRLAGGRSRRLGMSRRCRHDQRLRGRGRLGRRMFVRRGAGGIASLRAVSACLPVSAGASSCAVPASVLALCPVCLAGFSRSPALPAWAAAPVGRTPASPASSRPTTSRRPAPRRWDWSPA